MKLRTWPVLVLAFTILIALIAISGWSALARAQRIFGEISTLHQRYQNGEKILSTIRTEIHVSGLLVRDYLLDRSNLTAKSYRDQLVALRTASPKELEQLKTVIGADEFSKLDRLDEELDGYWNALEPIFEWSPDEKLALSSSFLRREVLPRRNAALEMARELRNLNEANLDRQRKAVIEKENELPRFVGRMLAVTLMMGLLVAAGSVFRTSRLEQRSEVQRRRAETAERELRRLTQKQVKAQEEERRHISRELHDEVGQMLTAQRMEIRNLKQLRTAPEEEFLAHLEDMARLSEDALRAVRDIAMGLRPSMLDDIGLQPALGMAGQRILTSLRCSGRRRARRLGCGASGCLPDVRLPRCAGGADELRPTRSCAGDPDCHSWA